MLTLVSSVGRAWDCSEVVCHPRVSGSSPERGICFYKYKVLVHDLNLFFNREICSTIQYGQNRVGD